MTEYIILRKDPGANPGQWHLKDGTFKASSAKRALAIAGDKLGDNMPQGEYVAVPLRNWKPLHLTVETIAKVTIG